MELKFLDARSHRQEIRRLYTTAFPRQEQAPLAFLFHRAKRGKADFQAVFDGEIFVGLTLVAGTNDIVTLMFFAIEDAVRGRGYGSRILRAVQQKYHGKRLFLNIEPLDPAAPNYAQRVKRKAFYLRNGFEDLQYTVREAGVTYEMLSFGGPVSRREYEQVMQVLFGRLLYFLIRTL